MKEIKKILKIRAESEKNNVKQGSFHKKWAYVLYISFKVAFGRLIF